MIDGASVLAVVMARGGSKGLPRKNLATLGGKPLVAWSIMAARASRRVDRTILSSEDAEIIEVARDLGCEVPFVRHAALAGDATTAREVLQDALRRVPGHDYAVLLQPTSPLRSAADIDACIEHCARTGAPACVSVSPLSKPAEWLMRLGEDGRMTPLLNLPITDRRQDSTPVYAPNGAVFVVSTEWFQRENRFYGEETVAWVMPPERSIDIDSAHDLAFARALVAEAAVQEACK